MVAVRKAQLISEDSLFDSSLTKYSCSCNVTNQYQVNIFIVEIIIVKVILTLEGGNYLHFLVLGG